MPIIESPAERQARAQQKRQALLRFLRDELYTSPDVAGLVMGVGERAARQTIAGMESAGLVKRHQVKLMPQLPAVVIVGITSQGQAAAFDPATEQPVWRVFQPSRFSLITLTHNLDIQKLRLAAEKTGRVQKWVPADRMAPLVRGIKKPDAVFLTVSGERVALEVERTQKNRQRYEQFLSGHLQAIAQGKWSRVVVASPSLDFSNRLAAVIGSVRRVQVAGIDTQITPAHLQKIAFTDYARFAAHV